MIDLLDDFTTIDIPSHPSRLADAPSCPSCDAVMIIRRSSFVYPDGRPRLFYGCSRYPECHETHGAHPDGRPLGIPAKAATRRLRMLAHEYFDRLWQGPGVTITRTQAYSYMGSLMGMSVDDSHIGKFTDEQCIELIGKLECSHEWAMVFR
jgi:hypothetical protein